jgi:Phosphotransferase enzyme family
MSPGVGQESVVPDGLGPFYRDVIAVDQLEPYGAASAAYRLDLLARTLPFPVVGARLVPSNNNDVWRLAAGYLRVAWRGDRDRLAREAELLGRLRDVVPVPEILGLGGDDRLSWSLSAAVPGVPLEGVCTWPAPAGLRVLAREAAGMLRAMHSWPLPADLTRTLRRPAADPDPLRRGRAGVVHLGGHRADPAGQGAPLHRPRRARRRGRSPGGAR